MCRYAFKQPLTHPFTIIPVPLLSSCLACCLPLGARVIVLSCPSPFARVVLNQAMQDERLLRCYGTKWPLCVDMPLSNHSFLHSPSSFMLSPLTCCLFLGARVIVLSCPSPFARVVLNQATEQGMLDERWAWIITDEVAELVSITWSQRDFNVIM